MLKKKPPLCVVIAGPNGAGKTTFAREFLPAHHGIIHFVNADLVAGGLSTLRPQLAARAAGRPGLAELGRLGKERKDFAFETTLSGLGYARLLRGLKAKGYRLEMVYLQIESPQLARRRIAARVKQGGHYVPKQDVERRFARSWRNFQSLYRPLADRWTVFDNSGSTPQFVDQYP